MLHFASIRFNSIRHFIHFTHIFFLLRLFISPEARLTNTRSVVQKNSVWWQWRWWLPLLCRRPCCFPLHHRRRWQSASISNSIWSHWRKPVPAWWFRFGSSGSVKLSLLRICTKTVVGATNWWSWSKRVDEWPWGVRYHVSDQKPSQAGKSSLALDILAWHHYQYHHPSQTPAQTRPRKASNMLRE